MKKIEKGKNDATKIGLLKKEFIVPEYDELTSGGQLSIRFSEPIRINEPNKSGG